MYTIECRETETEAETTVLFSSDFEISVIFTFFTAELELESLKICWKTTRDY